jgi:O-antigen/teichoic acid export membrane protein
MRKLKLRLSGGRAEAGIAMITFGGSSLYWLALAFALPTAAYGEMMTLQAAVLIVVMIFTFRTHDLFFNLIAQHGCPADVAYRRTLRIELTAGSVGAIVCTLTALALEPTGGGWRDAIGIAAFAFLASLAVIHGATIGKLRYLTRGDIISKTDLLTAVAWALACATVPFAHRQSAVLPLIIGSAPPATRTFALLIAVRRFLPQRGSLAAGEAPVVEVGSKAVVQFLAGAQLTNFLKNASISIETLILAAFVTPAAVGMYRVARAVQGASNAAMNVSYQRIYPALARAKTPRETRQLETQLQKSSMLTCFLLYPVSAATALVYALLKPNVGIIELQLITLGSFLALLPAAVQQSSFATLSLAGDHKSVAFAYLGSLGLLALTSLALFLVPRMEVFIVGLIISGLVRLMMLRSRSKRIWHAPAAAGA